LLGITEGIPETLGEIEGVSEGCPLGFLLPEGAVLGL